MLFTDVVGQNKVKAELIQLVAAGKVPHALLLVGPEGCGKLALAWAFARYLLCTDRRGAESCDQCSNCRKAKKLIHPDLHFSFPTVGRNATSEQFLPQWREAMKNPYLSSYDWLQIIAGEKGNAQGNINKEECLRIVKKLSLKAFESDKKIMILWLPEFLQKEGNRLLKIIEEPPTETYFILVAENQDLILNTILSRCQTFHCQPLQDDEVAAGLVSGKWAEQAGATTLARLASGNFNEAVKLATSQQKDNTSVFLDWLRKCYRGNGADIVSWSEQMTSWNKEDQKYFFNFGLLFIREYIVMKITGNDSWKFNESENQTARKLFNIIALDQAEVISEVFNNALFALERNANQRLLFLDASIRLKRILRRKDLKTEPAWQYANT